MLKFVNLLPWLRFAVTKNRHFNNVIIYPIHICVGVVNTIVFDLPDELIASQKIHAIPYDIIHLGVRRKSSMTCIVHYIHSHQSESESEKGTY